MPTLPLSSPTNPSNILSTPLKRMPSPTTNTSRNVPSVLSHMLTNSSSAQSQLMTMRCQMSISLHLHLKFLLTTTLHCLKLKRTSTATPTQHVKSKPRTMPCKPAATSVMPLDVPTPSPNPSPQSSNLHQQHTLRQSPKDLCLRENMLAAAAPTTLASRTMSPTPTPLPAWIRVITKVTTTPIHQDRTATMMRSTPPSGHHYQ